MLKLNGLDKFRQFFEQLRQYIASSGILAPQNGHAFKTSTPICQQTICI